MLSLLPTRTLVKWGSIIFLVLSGIGGSYYIGVHHTKTEQEVRDQKEYIDTMKRINNAPVSTDRDSALEQLRSMGDVR